MSKPQQIDPFVSSEPEVEVDAATSLVLRQRVKTASDERLVSTKSARERNPEMALQVRYHEDALADLEEIFSWSSEAHPETTAKFADDLFNTSIFLGPSRISALA